MYKALTAGEGKKRDLKKFKHDCEFDISIIVYGNIVTVPQVMRRTTEMTELAKEEIAAEIEDLRESLRAAHKLMIKYKNELNGSANSTPSVSICQD